MADGTIIIDTEIDNSGAEKGINKAINNMKSQTEKLAKEYEKQGMSASKAYEKAWNEIVRSSSTQSNKVSNDWKNSSDKIKTQVERLTAEYKRQGMSAEEAYKKAWNDIESSAKKKSEETANDWKGASEKIKSTANTGLKVLAGAAIGAGVALAGVGVESIKVASDLNEVDNVVQTTFQSGTNQINDWANKASDSFGLSTLQAKQFTGTLGAMMKSSGITGQALVGMSENMVGLAGDFASFYNLKPEEAFEKLRAGISGETEPLKQVGINMSVANLQAYALSKGITKTYDSMSQAEQVQLRYNYLMSVSKDQQGDFAKTSDSFANQMRIASLNVKSLFADIGQLLLPVARNAVSYFNYMADSIRQAFNSDEVKEKINNIVNSVAKLIYQFIELVIDWFPKIVNAFQWILDHGSGIAASIASITVALKVLETAIAIKKVVDGISALGGVAKAAQAGLALIGGPVTLVIMAIAALVAGIVVLWNTNEGFRNAVISAWNKIKETASVVWNSIVKFFTETIPNAWKSVKALFTETIPQAFKKLWEDIKTAFNNGWNAVKTFFTETIPNFIKNIPNYLAAGFGTILGFILKAYMTLIIDTGNAIDSVIKWFESLPSRIGAWLKQAASNITEWAIQVYTNMSNSIDNTITAVGEWFKSLPGRIKEGLSQAIESAREWGNETYDTMRNKASEIIDGIGEWFNNLPDKMSNIGRNIVAGLKQGVEDAWSSFKSWIGGLCDNFTSGFMKGWDIHSPSRVFRDLIGKNIVAGIQVGVDYEFPNLQKSVQGNISQFSKQMKDTVGYETAKTTANVVAQNNFDIKQADNNSLSNIANKLKIDNKLSMIVDGKELMVTLAPYQDEFENYKVGREV